tara:strand:+ start:498 stop:698 length:201 start_codon:yes stop_codon:yes gene_type:complete
MHVKVLAEYFCNAIIRGSDRRQHLHKTPTSRMPLAIEFTALARQELRTLQLLLGGFLAQGPVLVLR